MKHFRCNLTYITVRDEDFYCCLNKAVLRMREYEINLHALYPFNIEIEYHDGKWLASFPVDLKDVGWVDDA